MSALSIGKLAAYTVGADYDKDGEPFVYFDPVPIRPGEKIHETLLTEEEGWYATGNQDSFLLQPTTAHRFETAIPPYSSDMAPELTKEELTDLLANG
jgi:FlaA1/EpsC-like NDP-sugar epimerase